MPCDYKLYPPDWFIKRQEILTRASQTCECTGQCGLHPPNPTLRRCVERNATKARFAKGRVVLTIAHLCKCDPLCSDTSHLIAACQRCHLRIDSKLHAQHRLQTQRARGTVQPEVQPPWGSSSDTRTHS